MIKIKNKLILLRQVETISEILTNNKNNEMENC